MRTREQKERLDQIEKLAIDLYLKGECASMSICIMEAEDAIRGIDEWRKEQEKEDEK